jgi:hypothetical protein
MLTFRILLNGRPALTEATTIDRLADTFEAWSAEVADLARAFRRVTVLAEYGNVTRILWRQ